MNSPEVVELHPPRQNVVCMTQVGKGVLPADDALYDAVVGFDVCVLFRRRRSCELVLNAIRCKVLTYEMRDELTAIVATHSDLRDHRQASLNVLEERHHIFLLDTPLHEPADVESTLDVEHCQHHSVAPLALYVHVLDVEF